MPPGISAFEPASITMLPAPGVRLAFSPGSPVRLPLVPLTMPQVPSSIRLFRAVNVSKKRAQSLPAPLMLLETIVLFSVVVVL